MSLRTRRLYVVLVTAAAFAVSALHWSGPVSVAVMVVFLASVPGVALLGDWDPDDRITQAIIAVAASLAAAAVAVTVLLYVERFDAPHTVGTLGVIALVAVLWPRRRAGAVASLSVTPTSEPRPELDSEVPVLLLRIGRYAMHHGAVCAARSFGRAGVPVYAVVEHHLTPLALSRYVDRALVWRTRGDETAEELVEGLRTLVERLPGPMLLVPGDDEAAVLVAEHADELRDLFLVPEVPADLPRRLASKRGLQAACVEHDTPTPACVFPASMDALENAIPKLQFPVVVKRTDPFDRLTPGSFFGTTVVEDADRLREIAGSFDDVGQVTIQEYIPQDTAQDWIFHGTFDEASEPLVAYTGVKLRSWPVGAGVTTYARAADNPELMDLSLRFCRSIGYQGIVDMDWRYDGRDGEYKLVDCNPRVGAQFALFETGSDLDVLRALHLHLTGRAVPGAENRDGRGIRVENLDLPARVVTHRHPTPVPEGVAVDSRPVRVWWAPDDLAPYGAMLIGMLGLGFARIRNRFRRS